jgi:hypothetical protein
MRRFIPLVVLAALLAAGAAVIVAVDTYKPKPAVACGTNGCWVVLESIGCLPLPTDAPHSAEGDIPMKRLFVLAAFALVLAAGTVTVLAISAQPAVAGPCVGANCW